MELIKIENRNGKQVVSAREVHEFLEIRTHITTWVQRCIDKYFTRRIKLWVYLWTELRKKLR